jgi:hypothetical protein
MEKETLILFRVIKIFDDNGNIFYRLEVPKEEGSNNIISFSVYSNLEKLADGIYDYFDYKLLFF